MTDSKQARALHDLWGLYWEARNHGVPWEWALPDQARVESDFAERTRWFTRLDNKIEWAKQDLLKSGFDVPDRWLTVKAVGTLTFSPVPHPPDQPTAYRLAYDGADLPALQAVLDEMRVAIYRETFQPAGQSVCPVEDCPSEPTWLSASDLARGYCLTNKLNALEKRLARWRFQNGNGWTEVPDVARRSRDPKFLYDPRAVKEVIDAMQGES